MVELNREELYQDLEEMENDLRLYPIEEGCRKPTYYFTDGFEFYVTEIYIDFRILEHVKKSFPKFHQLSVSSEMDQGFSTLSVKLTL